MQNLNPEQYWKDFCFKDLFYSWPKPPLYRYLNATESVPVAAVVEVRPFLPLGLQAGQLLSLAGPAGPAAEDVPAAIRNQNTARLVGNA